jgi:hypothetical protein
MLEEHGYRLGRWLALMLRRGAEALRGLASPRPMADTSIAWEDGESHSSGEPRG